MGFKLEKPFTDIQKANFICNCQGLNYYEDNNCIIMYLNTEKIENGESIDISQTPEYLAQKALDREMEFKSNFFEITGYGWYRKQPKGYSSAIESLNTVFNAVSALGLLPMGYITFYTKPDFTNESQCTDEWLIENSFKNQEMTVEQFGLFYKTAITIWNMQEH